MKTKFIAALILGFGLALGSTVANAVALNASNIDIIGDGISATGVPLGSVEGDGGQTFVVPYGGTVVRTFDTSPVDFWFGMVVINDVTTTLNAPVSSTPVGGSGALDIEVFSATIAGNTFTPGDTIIPGVNTPWVGNWTAGGSVATAFAGASLITEFSGTESVPTYWLVHFGTLFDSGSFLNHGGNLSTLDFNLQAYSVVPVPAAVWLFGTAIVGLFGLRKKSASAVAA